MSKYDVVVLLAITLLIIGVLVFILMVVANHA